LRVVSLHPDVLVATSAIWQTNCTIVCGRRRVAAESGPPDDRSEIGAGDEAFVIDSPVLPEELEALPALLEQAGFPAPSGMLATHADWDHLLGRLAFPGASLGCAESTCARIAASPGEAQRELRTFDESFHIERPGPLMLGSIQPLPVPGRCSIGERELELHPTAGHTEDGMAVVIAWAGVLVVGDYLSPVEPPQLGRESSADLYIETLERLRPLVAAAEQVVPGHGPVLDRERALGVLEEHIASLSRG
jgi:glyoxylase-like metal-dependent hydrolase (beta-lactamase superfamily II)